MNFKKKKEVGEVKGKAEEVQPKRNLPKKVSKPKDDSYLGKLNSKLELHSKKDSSTIAPSSERVHVRKPKSKPLMDSLSLAQGRAMDLRMESLRNVIKPPETIMSMIEHEYGDIVATENVVMSIRSIRLSESSLADSDRSNIKRLTESLADRKSPILARNAVDVKVVLPVDQSKLDGQELSRERSQSNWDQEEDDIALQSVNDDEPKQSKFLRYDEHPFRLSQQVDSKLGLRSSDRLTFQGFSTVTNPDRARANEQVVKEDTEPRELDAAEDANDFMDIFTPKGTREPVESLQREQTPPQHNSEPSIFVKQLSSCDNLPGPQQQDTVCDKKGATLMDTEAPYESERALDGDNNYLSTNIFELGGKSAPRVLDSKPSAKFNDLDLEYMTSNFNARSDPESETELLQNIHNLIEKQTDEGWEQYRHERPLQPAGVDRQEEQPRPIEQTGQPAPVERMKRVLTFANVHKLAKPDVEDQAFIRNYYAHNDYGQAIIHSEEESRDSLDVTIQSQRGAEEGGASVKSDRYHRDVDEGPSMRFQSATNANFAVNSKADSRRLLVDSRHSSESFNDDPAEIARWQINYTSKDTQDVDNTMLDEMNAVYKHDGLDVQDIDSRCSDDESLSSSDRNVFGGANKDNSFDEDEQKPGFSAHPGPEYFTLGNMVMYNSRVQTVEMLTAQMENAVYEQPEPRPDVARSGRDGMASRGSRHEFEESDDSFAEIEAEVARSFVRTSKDDAAKQAVPKHDPAEFEDKFNELIVRMLNRKAAMIQRFWRSSRGQQPNTVILADLFREFVKMKRRNENFVRKNCDMKGVQTSNYSIKIIQREFVAYLDEVMQDSPNAEELWQLVGDLSLLIKKLGISGN